MGLSNAYYKLEDKWFSFLDWLDAHKFPAYKIVDPLEKHGVPSLPVFVAILLIAGWFAFSTLIAPTIPGEGIQFSVSVADQNTQTITGARVVLVQNGANVFTATTGADGIARLRAPPGDYELVASKTGCDPQTTSIRVTGDMSKTLPPIITNCKAELGRSVTLGFAPTDVKKLDVKAYDENGDFNTHVSCDSNPCSFEVKEGFSYLFASEKYTSGEALNYDTIISLAEQGQALALSPVNDNKETGIANIELEKDSGPAVGVRVRLVNPQNPDQELSGVLSQVTDDTGRVALSGKIGDKFKVKTDAKNDVAGFLSSEQYEFTPEVQYLSFSLPSALPTQILVKGTTEGEPATPLAGVSVKLFEGDVEKAKTTTDNNGRVVLGLEPGKRYYATFSIDGYRPERKPVSAGNNITVVLASLNADELSKIIAEVSYKDTDEPAFAVLAQLKQHNAETGLFEPSAYSDQTTDEDGRAEFSVPIGKYCVVVTPQGGTPTNCTDATTTEITKGKDEILVTLRIDAVRYALRVRVLKENGENAAGAQVSIIDANIMTIIGSAQSTSGTGLTTFNVKRMQPYYVFVDFTDPATKKRYSHYSQQPPLTASENVSIRLSPLETNIAFKGVYTCKEIREECLFSRGDGLGFPLVSGKYYFLAFDVGLPNVSLPEYYNQRWDAVDIELEDTEGYVVFVPPVLDDDMSVLPYEVGETVTIKGSYDFAGATRTVSVPVLVAPGIAKTTPYSIKYNAKWTKSAYSVTEPAQADRTKRANFSITMGDFYYYADKKVGVWTCVENADKECLSPLALSYSTGAEVGVRVQVKYFGDDTLNEPVTIVDKYKNLAFTDAEALVQNADETANTTLQRFEAFAILGHNITLPEPGLGKGETLFIHAKATLTSALPTPTYIVASAGTSSFNRNALRLNVVGAREAFINLAPDQLFDLLDELNFSITVGHGTSAKTLKLAAPVAVMGAVTSPGYWDGIDPDEQGVYHVRFDERHKLVENDRLTIQAGPRSEIQPTTIEREVSACIEMPNLEQAKPIFAVAGRTCKINLNFEIDGELKFPEGVVCGETGVEVTIPIKKECSDILVRKISTVNVEGCTPGVDCERTTGEMTREAETGFAQPVTFKYTGEISEEEAKQAYLYAIVRAESANKRVKKDYVLPLRIGVGKIIPTEGELFTPPDIQSYDSLSFNCRAKWCNADQAMKYVYDKYANFDACRTTTSTLAVNLVDQNSVTAQHLADGLRTAGATLAASSQAQTAADVPSVPARQTQYFVKTGMTLLPGVNTLTVETGRKGEGCFVFLSRDKTTPIPTLEQEQPDAHFLPLYVVASQYQPSFNSVSATPELQRAIYAQYGIKLAYSPGSGNSLKTGLCSAGTEEACQKLAGQLPPELDAKKTPAIVITKDKEVWFVAQNPAQITELVEEYEKTVSGGGGFLVVKKNALVLGPALFGYNSSVEVDESSVRQAIASWQNKPIDKVFVAKTAISDKKTRAVISDCRQRAQCNANIQDILDLNLPNSDVPDNGILWTGRSTNPFRPGERLLLFARSPGETAKFLHVAANGPSDAAGTTQFLFITKADQIIDINTPNKVAVMAKGLRYVVNPQRKTMSEFNALVTEKVSAMRVGETYATVVYLTGGDCALNLASIGGKIKNKYGTDASIFRNNVYLTTLAKTGEKEFTIYAELLAVAGPNIGGAQPSCVAELQMAVCSGEYAATYEYGGDNCGKRIKCDWHLALTQSVHDCGPVPGNEKYAKCAVGDKCLVAKDDSCIKKGQEEIFLLTGGYGLENVWEKSGEAGQQQCGRKTTTPPGLCYNQEFFSNVSSDKLHACPSSHSNYDYSQNWCHPILANGAISSDSRASTGACISGIVKKGYEKGEGGFQTQVADLHHDATLSWIQTGIDLALWVVPGAQILKVGKFFKAYKAVNEALKAESTAVKLGRLGKIRKAFEVMRAVEKGATREAYVKAAKTAVTKAPGTTVSKGTTADKKGWFSRLSAWIKRDKKPAAKPAQAPAQPANLPAKTDAPTKTVQQNMDELDALIRQLEGSPAPAA